MITGAHVVLFSPDAEADRAFLRDELDLPAVDAGDGWLIFRLPPTEIAVHPTEQDGEHEPETAEEFKAEFYFMCDDIESQVADLSARGNHCSEVIDAGWGRLTHVRLPSGRQLGLYEPRHPTALDLDHQ